MEQHEQPGPAGPGSKPTSEWAKLGDEGLFQPPASYLEQWQERQRQLNAQIQAQSPTPPAAPLPLPPPLSAVERFRRRFHTNLGRYPTQEEIDAAGIV